MKKNMKILFVMVTVVFFTFSMVMGGCAKQGDNNESTSTTTSTSTQSQTQSQSEAAKLTVDITWGISTDFTPNPVKDSPVEKYLEEKFNVNIDAVAVTDVTLASGEVPDVFVVYATVKLAAYNKQGILSEVDMDAVKEKIPEYYKGITSLCPQVLKLAVIDGKYWAIPSYNKGYPYTAQLWRGDLLVDMGMEIPKTLDDFKAVFAAYVKTDTDGVQDTYGITAVLSTEMDYFFNSYFGAYGVEPKIWFERDGKVVNGSVMPETKQALTMLRQWYEEKLIDPEFVTETYEIVRQKLYNGKIMVCDEGIHKGSNPNSGWYKGAKDVDPKEELVSGPNPKGPGGDGIRSPGFTDIFIAFGSQMKDQPDKMDRLYEIIRGMCTDRELSATLDNGILGTDWAYGDPKEEPTFKLPIAREWEYQLAHGVYIFRLGSVEPKEMRDSFIPSWLLERYGKIGSESRWSDALMGLATPSEMNFAEELNMLTLKSFAQIINGEKPLDYFDEYVKEWNSKGGDTWTKEANELYAGIYK